MPECRLPVWFEMKPISHVDDAAPSVPQMNSGVARLVAAGPKVLENRATLVGNIHDVPKPATADPRLNAITVLADSVRIMPTRTISRPSINILFSFKNRNKAGANPRPITKNEK